MSNNFFKGIFPLCVLLMIAGPGYAQKFRLNGYGSYVLDGTYHIYYGNENFYEGRINHGLQLGVGTEYLLSPNYGVELNYFRRNATVFPEGAVNSSQVSAALRFHYVLLGINAYPVSGPQRFQPYGGVSAGVVVQDGPKSNDAASSVTYHAITKFTWAARLGGLFWLSGRVGIKAQAQWLSAVQFQNAVVNFDVHRLNGVPAEASIANQFEIGSGFAVKLGK